MRRVPRLRTPATAAGFGPSSAPSAPLRAAAAAPIASACTRQSITASSRIRLPSSQTRYLTTTTPLRRSPPQQPTDDARLLAEEEEEPVAPTTPAVATTLVFPSGITDAPAPATVTDATYIPAETADGLEEVGGLADWWEDPSHGAADTVRAAARAFGPADGNKITDPAVLEVLARRAVVEALVVGKFVTGGSRGKKVDVLFAASANGEEAVERIAKADVVAGEEGAATLGDFRDWQRVWDLLRLRVKRKGKKVEATQLTPEVAREMVQSWGPGWRKAELRDPVIKFFVGFSDRDVGAFFPPSDY
ncbi:hypothetical protein BT67DRAFT_41367 [Trichocladium antarcticum]|uniref:Uncharacterized protein n=1 Tax=Trichocladium antarcticum TaxID=1450529 RepID=A0AAN6ZDE1_9PEZI|nr:hypothetical protein BT67DRAFT_41367 [Trichocladium antarcticum]